MSQPSSEAWGVYADINDARAHLCAYTTAHLGPDVGITWTAAGVISPIRPPRLDGDRLGNVLMFELMEQPYPPSPPPGILRRLERLVRDGLEAYGQSQVLAAQADLALAASLPSMLTSKRLDGLGVALDVICIAASVAALPAAPLVGAIAFGAGIFLLAADGSAFVLEMSGQERIAERIKKTTEPYRVAAMILSIPDFFIGGARAVRELSEALELRPLDASTAVAADGLGVRATDPGRAARYQQIAEKARLRTQLRSEQIRASWTHEITPRGTVPPSILLLLKEESDPDSWSRQFLSRLRLHVVSVGHV